MHFVSQRPYHYDDLDQMKMLQKLHCNALCQRRDQIIMANQDHEGMCKDCVQVY